MLIRSPQELALFVISQRKKLKLSQAEVGSQVGLKQKTISAFENKPEGTKVETLFQILSAVNLNISLLPKDKASTPAVSWKEEW